MEVEFRDGIYMLSLLRCLQKDELTSEDIDQWDYCYNNKYISDDYKESFREPYSKLKNKWKTQIVIFHNIIKDCYERFINLDLEFMDDFLDYGSLTSFEGENEKLFTVIERFFDYLEECGNIRIQRPDKISQKELEKYSSERHEELEKLWNTFWKNVDDKYNKLSIGITDYAYSLKFEKNGCINESNLEKKKIY